MPGAEAADRGVEGDAEGEPRQFSVALEPDGRPVSVLDWGGSGPAIVLLHPNGFCAGVFDPLARRLAAAGRHPVGIDLRGHGGSWAPSPAEPGAYRFDAMAADVLGALVALGMGAGPLDLLGESLGGGVGVLVDRLRPGLLGRLVLCEPIAMGLDHGADPAGDRGGGSGGGGSHGNVLAMGARRRRRVWPSREAMQASYASRAPLDQLAPEALAGYVRWGTRVLPDGRVELACDPEVEATLFEASALPFGAAAAWDHLAELTASAVVAAGRRSTLPGPWFEAMAGRAGCPMRWVDGGHFFLQEDTDRAATLVLDLLSS
ncbi:MAG: alpha/beta fold hydrolase [Acidimicrobiales bacterium]